jgi:DNA-directed RNA polymerase subunit RPC12/RpoP
VSNDKKSDKCIDCEGPLELIELDLRKGTKTTKCQSCGLYHFYKKEFLSGWKLLKATKNPSET